MMRECVCLVLVVVQRKFGALSGRGSCGSHQIPLETDNRLFDKLNSNFRLSGAVRCIAVGENGPIN